MQGGNKRTACPSYSGFTVTYVAGNIVLAGGKYGKKSAQTYLMDLETDRWKESSLPALNVAR